MGRVVHCQQAAIGTTSKSPFGTHLMAGWRENTFSACLVQSGWSRFLFQRWHSTYIRVKELRKRRTKIWSFLLQQGHDHRLEPMQPTEVCIKAKIFRSFVLCAPKKVELLPQRSS